MAEGGLLTPTHTPGKRPTDSSAEGANQRYGKALEGGGAGIESAEPASGMVGSVAPLPRPCISTLKRIFH